MADNVVKWPFHRPPGLLHSLWIPLLALLGLLLIAGVMILPAFMLALLLLLVLGYMAVRLPLWIVFVWGLIYAGAIFAVRTRDFPEAYAGPGLGPCLGTVTFVIGGLVVFLLVGHRARLEKSGQALLGIINSLPVAVVVSDVSGNILLLNGGAEKLFHGQANNLAGLSYFSTFTNPGEQGRAIARYIGYFDPKNPGPFTTTLQIRENPPRLLKATISIFESGKRFYAVTMIEPASEESAVPGGLGTAPAAAPGSLET